MNASNSNKGESKEVLNTDVELWREPSETEGMSYYANSIHRTEDGKVGINVGGYVVVMSLAEWHQLAKNTEKQPTNNLEEKIEHIVEEGMWTVESQQSNLDYTIPKLLDLFTSYANEVADKRVRKYVDLLELAWGIIANSYNGDWTTASKEWQDAAARWRDEYHNVLNQLRRGE